MPMMESRRKLRNTKTGVTVTWNKYLAQMPGMEEVTASGARVKKEDPEPEPEPESTAEPTAGPAPIFSEEELDELSSKVKSTRKKDEMVALAHEFFGLTFDSGTKMSDVKKAVRKEIARARG